MDYNLIIGYNFDHLLQKKENINLFSQINITIHLVIL